MPSEPVVTESRGDKSVSSIKTDKKQEKSAQTVPNLL